MKIPYTDTHVYLGNPDRDFNLNAEQKAQGPTPIVPGIFYAGRKSFAGTPLMALARTAGAQLRKRETAKINRLGFLDLNGKQLCTLPAGIGVMQNLRMVDLRRNQFTQVPSVLLDMPSTTKVDLRNNPIPLTGMLSVLAEQAKLRAAGRPTPTILFGDLLGDPIVQDDRGNLIGLKLSSNELANIAAEIVPLWSSSTLDLRYNKLDSLPNEICQMRNLTHLDLNNNQLTQVPRALLDLPAVTKVDLRNNPIPLTEMLSVLAAQAKSRAAGRPTPTILFGDPLIQDQSGNLMGLKLSSNELANKAAEVVALWCSSALDLSNNKLDSLPNEICQMKNLTHLDLSHNQFTQVPRALLSLPSEVVINLGDNPIPISEIISVLDAQAQRRSSGLPTPKILLGDLRHRGHSPEELGVLLEKIGPLTQLSQMKTLDLQSNQLTQIPRGLLELPIDEIDLRNNPLPDLEIVALVIRMAQRAENGLALPRCIRIGEGEIRTSPSGSIISSGIKIISSTSQEKYSYTTEHPLTKEEVGYTIHDTFDWPYSTQHHIGYRDVHKYLDLFSEGNPLKLKRLVLHSGGPIDQMPLEICELKQLQELVISNYKLNTLPDEISQLRNLRRLDLSSNRFTQVPRVLLDLPSETFIDLKNNAIPIGEIINVLVEQAQRRAVGRVTPNIDFFGAFVDDERPKTDLGSLESSLMAIRLLAATGQLTYSPPPPPPSRVEKFQGDVIGLNLKDSRLNKLPDSIGGLPHLGRLVLKGNQLSGLPDSIRQLHNLRILDLDNNWFTRVPRALLDFPAQTEIRMRGNQLPAEEINEVRTEMQRRVAAGLPVPKIIFPEVR